MRYLTNKEMGIKTPQKRNPLARMTKGKYRGWFVNELPHDYLLWYHHNVTKGSDHTAVDLELAHRIKNRR
jgi:uncharacterized protein (DUF3820 family)